MLKGQIWIDGEKRVVQIPQSFNDLSFQSYLNLLKSDDVAHAILGVTTEQLGEFAAPFYQAVRFLKSKRMLKKAIRTPEWINELNIRQGEWGKLERCKQIIKNNEGRQEELFINDLIKVYYQEKNLLQTSAGEAIGAMHHFFDKLNEFFKTYERLNDYEPDPDEIRAGVKDLDKYGYFPTLISLCNGDPLKYDAMLKQPAGIIYRTLLINFEQSQIQKRLSEIKMKKK